MRSRQRAALRSEAPISGRDISAFLCLPFSLSLGTYRLHFINTQLRRGKAGKATEMPLVTHAVARPEIR